MALIRKCNNCGVVALLNKNFLCDICKDGCSKEHAQKIRAKSLERKAMKLLKSYLASDNNQNDLEKIRYF